MRIFKTRWNNRFLVLEVRKFLTERLYHAILPVDPLLAVALRISGKLLGEICAFSQALLSQRI